MSRLIGLLLVCIFALGACMTGPIADGGPMVAADDPASAYRLGANDKVRVIVFNEENLSGEFLISGSGMVSYPLIGDVKAAGLTVPEFQQALQTRLAAGYLRDPRVSVEVMNYRPFYILGEVNKPGEYPYSTGLTVLNAVARAEGFTYRADSRRVWVRRAGDNRERELALTSTTVVMPGDTIRIGERFF